MQGGTTHEQDVRSKKKKKKKKKKKIRTELMEKKAELRTTVPDTG